MHTVYLTRRNLQTLLNKLDRNKRRESISACTLQKYDTEHPEFPATGPTQIIALEDDIYYTDREPGVVWPEDDPNKQEKLNESK